MRYVCRPAEVLAERVEQVQAHHRQEPDGDVLEPLLVVDGGDEQEVEDHDLEPVLDDRLAVVGPRAHQPARDHGEGEARVGGVLRVRQPPLVRVDRPDGDREEHVDPLDVEVAEPRPDLERPVDEQEHVADEQPAHRGTVRGVYGKGRIVTGRVRGREAQPLTGKRLTAVSALAISTREKPIGKLQWHARMRVVSGRRDNEADPSPRAVLMLNARSSVIAMKRPERGVRLCGRRKPGGPSRLPAGSAGDGGRAASGHGRDTMLGVARTPESTSRSRHRDAHSDRQAGRS